MRGHEGGQGIVITLIAMGWQVFFSYSHWSLPVILMQAKEPV